MTWRTFFRAREQREHELDDEIQSHLQLAAEDRIRNGEPAEMAAISARREFGNRTIIREAARDLWGWLWLERLIQDLRFGIRTFARAPGTAVIVVLTLGLGVAANTAVFSIFDAVLITQLPYRDPHRLVSIVTRQVHTSGRAVFFDVYSDYENWRKNSRTFEGFTAATWAGNIGRRLTGYGRARTITALPVTADYFSVFGVNPALGRAFQPADTGHGCRVVLSHAFWQSVTHGDSQLIGKPLTLDDESCTVLGVMPAGFATYPNPPALLWILMGPPAQPDSFGVFVMGRLKKGVPISTAQAELLTMHHRLHQRDQTRMEPALYELQSEFTWLAGHNLRLSLIALFAAVMVVLVICCANAANLLLGRALTRQREMAIRAALGSGRKRLILQLLTESLLLSVPAAVLGAGLAIAAVHYFRVGNPIELPPTTVVQVNAGVLLFSVLLSIASAVLSGLAPAWRVTRTELIESLKAGGLAVSRDVAGRRLARALIGSEIALTMILLIGAGLLIGSVEHFAAAPLGFQPDGLMTAQVQLPRSSYAMPAAQLEFYDRLFNRLHSSHDFDEMALSTVVPLYGTGAVTVLAVEGRPDPEPGSILDAGEQTVSADYFRAMRIPLERGRFFDDGDVEDSEPVAIINDTLAARYFPAEDPIGKRIRDFYRRGEARVWLRVVGVVGDEKRTAAANEMSWESAAVVYRPWRQNPRTFATLVVRTHGGASGAGRTIREATAGIDPDVSVDNVEALSHTMAKFLAYPRFRGILLAAFASVALLLAVAGLYSVISRLVAHRTREIGIRMALGASRADVLRMVAMQSILPVGTGILFGLVAAWAMARLISSMLYGVAPQDPLVLAGAALGLMAASALATWLPARRATGVNPVTALRYE